MQDILSPDGGTFHDANLEDAIHEGDRVLIKVNYYAHYEQPFDPDEDGVSSWCKLNLINVEQIKRDHVDVDRFVMEGYAGSIMDIDRDGDTVIMTVFWFERGKVGETFRHYWFSGRNLKVDVIPCDETIVLSLVGTD